LPLVRFRAQAMQEAVPVGEGAMAAIMGLDDDAARSACQEAAQGQIVEPVNFNAPSQVVIAGHKAAVERGAAVAKAKGAKRAVMLPVSAPFHSSLLKPAGARLAEYLGRVNFSAPRFGVVNNVDVTIESEPQRIKDALARQASSPVRWVEVIRHIAAAGVGHMAECGPGRVLSGLARRIDATLEAYTIGDPGSLAQALQALK
jgi:[acyl-carrier-protein] S-malonyltransferase